MSYKLGFYSGNLDLGELSSLSFISLDLILELVWIMLLLLST